MTTSPEVARLPRFTAPKGGALTQPMLDSFEREGLLILEDFVSKPACDALKQRALTLIDGFDPDGIRSYFSSRNQDRQNNAYFLDSGEAIHFFFEEDAFDAGGQLRQSKAQSLNKIGCALHDLDPTFNEFSRTTELRRLVQSLPIAKPLLLQSMYLMKPPHIGAEVLCHQDSTYLLTEPESCIGLWFAIEDATVDNGCLYFIPGAHKGPLRQRYRRKGGDKLALEVLDESPWPEHLKVAAEVSAGSLVVFHGRTPHLSGHNLSDQSRHAYSLHVIDSDCAYPEDNWLQRSATLPLRGFDRG